MNTLLKEYTCIVYDKDKIVYKSKLNGVAPLIDFYNQENFEKKPYRVIDRIMGKSAVLLAILIGATEIETPIISEPALELANKFSLIVTSNKIVEYVINRDNTGQCPIESSVLDIDDIEEGYLTILKTLEQLKKNA